jgi:hypothetical protein
VIALFLAGVFLFFSIVALREHFAGKRFRRILDASTCEYLGITLDGDVWRVVVEDVDYRVHWGDFDYAVLRRADQLPARSLHADVARTLVRRAIRDRDRRNQLSSWESLESAQARKDAGPPPDAP